jgi:hypothetical protein
MTEENPRAIQRATLLQYARHLKSKDLPDEASAATAIETLVRLVDGYDLAMTVVQKVWHAVSQEDRDELFKVTPITGMGMLELYTLVRLGDIDPDLWLSALRDEGQLSRPGVIVPFNRQPPL